MKKVFSILLGMAAMILPANAQLLLPEQQKADETPLTYEQWVDKIKQEHPGLIIEQGLTPEQAKKAAASLEQYNRAPRKVYNGTGDNTEFWFNLPYAKQLGITVGMYYCTGNDGEVKLLIEDTSRNMVANWSGAIVGDRFHCIYGDLTYARYNLIIAIDFIYDLNRDWRLFKRVSHYGNAYTYGVDVAVDPTTQRVYGMFLNQDMQGYSIGWIDYDKKELNIIGPAQSYYVAIGMTGTGKLYGITYHGRLCEISLEDASERVIGETGIDVLNDAGRYNSQSGDIDQVNDVFYWCAVLPEGQTAIYAVDLETAQATKIHDLPDYTLTKCFMIPDNKAENGTPAAVTNLSTNFVETSTTGTVNFTLPTTTYDGKSLSGNLDYLIRVDGVDTQTGSGVAGTEQNVEMTLAEGYHRLDVYAKNSAGLGVKAKVTVYAGLDTPGEAQEPQLIMNGRMATVNWDAVIGQHGGYPGSLTYTVTRYPDNKLIASGITDLNLIDEIPDTDVKMYYYGIVASNGTESGFEAYTNRAASGRAYETPYFDEFNNAAYIQDNYTIIDANNDGMTWYSDISASQSVMKYSFMHNDWTNVPSDDWCILPRIALKAGKEYKLTYIVSTHAGDTHKVEMRMGLSPTIEGQTIELMPITDISQGTKKSFSFTFTPEADGEYYIGIHDAPGDILQADLAFESIAVEEVNQSGAPAAVSSPKVSAAPKGEMRSIISFTAPKKTVGKQNLTSITRIRVLRNNNIVHEFANPTPGETLTCEDTTLDESNNGVNFYQIVCTNEAGDGPRLQASGYIGKDIPVFSYLTLRIFDRFDKIELNWGKCGEVGKNGGYVDTEKVEYQVGNVIFNPTNMGYAYGDVIETLVDEDKYFIDGPTDEGDQYCVAYYIGAYNEYGQGGSGGTYPLIMGQPYTLPFTQSATNQRLGGRFMWAENNDRSSTYKYMDDSYDDDNGSFGWAHQNYYANWMHLNTGKISLEGSTNPTLMFAHKSEPGAAFELIPIVMRPNELTGDTLDVIDYTKVEGDEAVWKTEKYSLTDYMDEDYIFIRFAFRSNGKTNSAIRNKDILLDAINVIDLQMFNLSVDVDAPEKVTSGYGGDVNVIVHNMGENPASNYTVKLYVNNELQLTQKVTEPLQSMERKVVSMRYTPDVFTTPGRVTLRAEVEYAYDLDEDDNMMEAEMEIVSPEVNTPEDALCSNTMTGKALSWNPPSATVEDIVESFEGAEYTDFDLGGITDDVDEGMMGDWFIANYDKDNVTRSLSGVLYDNMGKTTAWMVFNAKKAEGTMPLQPHSGDKFAASFNGVNVQDNWLVTPELSGEAQTISFFANIPEPRINPNTDLPYTEDFEILYSTTDRQKDSFTLLGEETLDEVGWKQFSYDVPEGALFFAIHDVSQSLSAYGLFIDDVTLSRKAAMPVSYNIYGDGVLLQNVTSGTYAHVDGKASEYCVTAVYANGLESLPVPFVLYNPTGIETFVPQGEAFDVYSIDGMKVRSQATTISDLKKGVYVINGKAIVIK